MAFPPEFPLRVFYDGSCSVCAAEMDVYRRKERHGRLVMVDISDPAFDASPLGIPLDAFMHQMHAIDNKGRVYRGVEAFSAIWQAFPENTLYALLGTAVMIPGLNLVARGAYYLFARLRKYLPRRVPPCADGVCEHRRTRAP